MKGVVVVVVECQKFVRPVSDMRELMMRTPGQLAPLEYIWVRLAEMIDVPRSITMRSKSNSWGYRLHTKDTKTVVGLAKMFQA